MACISKSWKWKFFTETILLLQKVQSELACCLHACHGPSTLAYKPFISLQTNPFDLFETFFGSNMGGMGGGFPGMDSAGFGTRGRTTVTKGEDIR